MRTVDARTGLLATARDALGAGRPEVAAACLRRLRGTSLPEDALLDVMMELGAAEAYIDVPSAGDHLTYVATTGADPERRGRATDELITLLALTRPEAGPLGDREVRRLEPNRGFRAGGSDDESLRALEAAWRGFDRPTAIALARSVAAGPLTGPGDVPSHLRAAVVLLDAGDDVAAQEHSTTVITAATGWGHLPCRAAAHSVRSTVWLRRGRPRDAEADAREGLRLLAECGAGRGTGLATTLRALVVEALVDQARPAEAAEFADDPTTGPDGAALLYSRGLLRLATGRPGEAAACLVAAGAELRTRQVRNPAAMPWRSAAARAFQQAGDLYEAERLAAEEVRLARRWGAPGPLGRALRVLALLTAGPRRRDLLREAVEVLDQSLWLGEMALAQADTADISDMEGVSAPPRVRMRTA